MTDREAMQQALECIERLNKHGWILADFETEVYAALDSLKAALEQPVQEPVAWLYPEGFEALQAGKCWTAYPRSHEDCNIPLYIATPQQQQAEPVAWDKPSASFNEWWDGDRRRDTANPFTTDSFAYWGFEGWQAALAQRPWVGLTDEEIENAISDGFARGLDDGNVSNREVIHYVRVIEAALRSKNHD